MTEQEKREKVIKALECRLDINGSKYKHCLSCDYRHDIDHCQWACQTDGILEDALALLKAQEPQPPKHIHEEFPSHDWKLDEDGKIDLFAMDLDYHNGPSCKRCGYSFCMHCDPDGFTKKPCVIDKNVCPICGRIVYTRQNYC